MTPCIACGARSRNDEMCEGCGRPLKSSAQPTLQMQQQTVRRVSLTGEVVETTQAITEPTMALPPPQSGRMAPTPMQSPHPGAGGAYTCGQSACSSAYPGLAGSGAALPAAAYSATAVMEMAATEGPPLAERWEKALAIGLPILALSMLVGYFAPAALLVVVLANLLVLPLVLGATRAIPRYEDAILDCSVMLVVGILFGPLPALGIYLLTAMVKQECNPAIVAILVRNIADNGLFGIAFAPLVNTVSLEARWGLFNWLSFLGVCLSFLGWLLSSFFRGLDE